MLITSFRVRKIEAPTNRLVAKCTITFDGMFAVSDIKVLLKEEGDYYMGMPSRKTAAGTCGNLLQKGAAAFGRKSLWKAGL